MKHKLGFYAQYEKLDGSLIKTAVKMSTDIYKSNKDNTRFFWDLITDDPEWIYDYPEEDIPKISDSFDENIEKEYNPNYYQCECCFDYFTKDEMTHIATDNEEISICNYCV